MTSRAVSSAAIALVALGGQLGCGLCADRERTLTFQATLAPAAVVPPVTSTAVGFADVQARQTRDAATIIVVSYGVARGTDPSGRASFDLATVSAVHIHEGAAGTNGPVLFDVPLDMRDVSEIVGDAFPYRGARPFDDVFAAMRAGPLYLDVHTTQYPGGLLREQLTKVADQDWYCPSPN